MSETIPLGGGAEGFSEATMAEISRVKEYWEPIINRSMAGHTPTDFQAICNQAVTEMDQVTDIKKQDVLFWGQVYHLVTVEGLHTKYVKPKIIEPKLGESGGAVILRIPQESGGNGKYELYHAIGSRRNDSMEVYYLSYPNGKIILPHGISEQVESSYPEVYQYDRERDFVARSEEVFATAADVKQQLATGKFASHEDRLAYLEDMAVYVEVEMGVRGKDLRVKSDNAYSLQFSDDGETAEFAPLQVQQVELESLCLGITSFEEIGLNLRKAGRLADVPKQAGLCMVLAAGQREFEKYGVLDYQALLVPLDDDSLEYTLMDTVNTQGGQS